MSSAASNPAWDQALDPDGDGLVLQSRERLRHRLADRDRLASLAIALAFAGVVVAVATATETSRHPPLWIYVLFVGLYAALSRVEFEVGNGSALSTELAIVPMLFVLPLWAVGPCVALGLGVAHVRREATFDRILIVLVSSGHALGPVLVLLALGPADRTPAWSHWPLYVAALAGQFVFDFAFTSAREWLGRGVPPRSHLRSLAWVWLVDNSLAPVALLAAFAASEQAALALLVLPLVGLLKVFSRERVRRIDHALELGQAYRGTAFLLGDVVEADDAYTGEHSRDVVTLTLAVCDRLGLSQRDRRDAEFVALLHDVGKIRIPTEIVNKPGPLDAEERQVIETHTLIGEEMLGRVGGLLGDVGRLVRSCHERWDGSGYPDGLAGEEIPLIARIVCATDAFSAITTDRSYREARSIDEALAELRRCAGSQFDPRVVDAIEAALAALDAAA